MSHEYPRAFGAIMTTLWPVRRTDTDSGLLNLAVLVTERTGNDRNLGEKLEESVDYLVNKGMKPRGLMFRLHAWRTACTLSGCLPDDLEVRLDLIEKRIKEHEEGLTT